MLFELSESTANAWLIFLIFIAMGVFWLPFAWDMAIEFTKPISKLFAKNDDK